MNEKYEDLKERLTELRRELHQLYVEATGNADAIDRAAKEVIEIQEGIENARHDEM